MAEQIAPRLPAARRMDRMYRHQRHIYDLTRRYYLLGRDTLLDRLQPPPGGAVLEVACGTGRNLICAARRYPDARLFGFDISAQMLASAASKVAARGLTTRIRLAQADATAFDARRTFGIDGFDRVFVSYALSMIPAWRGALECAWGSVAPGGSLHVVDFGRQERLPAWFRGALLAWLRRFSVEPRTQLGPSLEALPGAGGVRVASLARGYACYAVLARL